MKQRDLLDLNASSDVGEFESRLVQIAQDMDFGLVAAALAVERPGRPALFTMIGNTPDGFLESSRDQAQVRRDPVMRRLRELTVPFAYDRRTYSEAGADDLWEEQARFGYRTGLAVALHLQAGRHFLLGMDRDADLPKDEVGLMRLLADLHLLAVYAQDAATRLLCGVPQVDLPRLTPREHEALVWASEGKTAEETGAILGISTRGVEFHLHNAMRKLGAPNKHAAVARAHSLGVLKRG